jgi:hypothetical protein
MLNRDQIRRFDRSRTAGYEQSCRAHQTDQNSKTFREYGNLRSAPSKACPIFQSML